VISDELSNSCHKRTWLYIRDIKGNNLSYFEITMVYCINGKYYFSYIGTRRKLPTCRKSLTNFITSNIDELTCRNASAVDYFICTPNFIKCIDDMTRVYIAWARFELTGLVVIGTICIGSYTTTTVPGHYSISDLH
jgi:hypothetical protein